MLRILAFLEDDLHWDSLYYLYIIACGILGRQQAVAGSARAGKIEHVTVVPISVEAPFAHIVIAPEFARAWPGLVQHLVQLRKRMLGQPRPRRQSLSRYSPLECNVVAGSHPSLQAACIC